MKTYLLYLKAHADMPDIEEYAVAPNKAEAVAMFHYWLAKYGWTKDEIRKNTERVESVGGVTR